MTGIGLVCAARLWTILGGEPATSGVHSDFERLTQPRMNLTSTPLLIPPTTPTTKIRP